MKKQLFTNNQSKVAIVKTELRNYAHINQLEFDEMTDTETNSWICQIRFKHFNKMPSTYDTATTVIFRSLSDVTLEVQVGKGKWGLKAWFAFAGFGMLSPVSLVLIPLAATGTHKQQNQTKEILELIERQLS